MEIIKKVSDMKKISFNLKKEGKKIAFVPTMGYFHEGHLDLMKRGKKYADIVVTSIFVNPTQFAPNEDFESYPRDYLRDFNLAEQSDVDFIFVPSNEEMYPQESVINFKTSGFTNKFEGVSRPTHFAGVATIVTKLFNSVKPHFALFGQKDYQQALMVKHLVRDLIMDIDIIIVPTVRENDGLAMSSRNIYLDKQERENATVLYRALEETKSLILAKENRREVINSYMSRILTTVPNLKIDYAVSAVADSLDEQDNFLPGQEIVLLIAVHLGKTRLIDNAVVIVPVN